VTTLGLLGHFHGSSGPVVPLALARLLERDEEVVPVGRARSPRSPGRPSPRDVLDQGLRERLHVEELALGDRVDDLLDLPSRTRSAMRAFMTITSTAATRPPSSFGSRRWLITPRGRLP
jgi:hypothetical protein